MYKKKKKEVRRALRTTRRRIGLFVLIFALSSLRIVKLYRNYTFELNLHGLNTQSFTKNFEKKKEKNWDPRGYPYVTYTQLRKKSRIFHLECFWRATKGHRVRQISKSKVKGTVCTPRWGRVLFFSNRISNQLTRTLAIKICKD